jgi:hypothetical protein
MKIFFFAFLLFILVSSALAQDEGVHTFFGITFNTAGYGIHGEGGFPGLGIEAGAKYKVFYMGLEYGVYGDFHNDTIFPQFNCPTGGCPHPTTMDEAASRESYFGFHAGVKISDWLDVGMVVLWSSQTINRLKLIDTVNYNYSSQSINLSWLNFGPDIRFYPLKHFVANLAYTKRRGGKFGIDYIF